ncbi:hypothetical protein PLESTF_001103200 [Pleodorina starrii]|nr:hypothetical protein PLESTF_001103200 [Pleodorina starrii]
MAEMVDVTTDQLREHTLAEAVERDRPLLDDQQGTPFHTADKEGGTKSPSSSSPRASTAGGGGLQGGGHGL